VENSQDLLSGVWREACRHIDISGSASGIARMLARNIPLSELVVRRIDVARSCLETVAVAVVGDQRASELARTNLTTIQLEWLLAWCNRRQVYRRPADGASASCAGEWSLLASRGNGANTMAGP
jgi:hypothetical protein